CCIDPGFPICNDLDPFRLCQFTSSRNRYRGTTMTYMLRFGGNMRFTGSIIDNKDHSISCKTIELNKSHNSYLYYSPRIQELHFCQRDTCNQKLKQKVSN